jgi:hypothetical protein
MSAAAILTALKTILPVGTPVASASVFIEAGPDANTATWPVLLLEIPLEKRKRTAIRAKASCMTVVALYLDRWESGPGGRTVEQIKADARAALTQMVANLDANPQLLVAGTANCNIAGDEIDVRIDGVIKDQLLGFPVIQGSLTIKVDDLWQAV